MLKSSLCTSIIFFLSWQAISHPPPPESDNKPSQSSNFLNENGTYGETTGGYGYLCKVDSCSEAQALSKFDFNCMEALNQGACFGRKKRKSRLKMEELSNKVFLSSLRQNLFEYLYLSTVSNPEALKNIKSVNSSNSFFDDLTPEGISNTDEVTEVKSNWPKENTPCLTDTEIFKKVSPVFIGASKVEVKPLEMPYSMEINSDDPTVPKGLGEKANALLNRHNPENIIKTLMYDKFLDQWEGRYAGDQSIIDSIKLQRNKMRGSYPQLFNDDGSLQSESEIIVTKMFKALGVSAQRICEGDLSITKAEEAIGKKIFEEKAKKSQTNYPPIVKELFENLEYIKSVSIQNKGDSTKLPTVFLDSIQKDINTLAKKQKEKEDKDKINLCHMGVSDIANKYPNVVRQTMIDLKKENLPLARFSLCHNEVKEPFSKPIHCGVIEGDMEAPDGMRLEIVSSSFPYGTKKGKFINVKKDKDGSIVIKDKIKFVEKTPLSDEIKKCLETKVSQSMMDDLNCQVGAPKSPVEQIVAPLDRAVCGESSSDKTGSTTLKRKCPTAPHQKRTPPVKFDIEISFDDNGGAEIDIYKCYRSEIADESKRGDCAEVEKYNVTVCVESGGRDYYCSEHTGVELEKCCKKYVKQAVAQGGLIRQNAENMTPGAKHGTWYHEIMHGMGLDDEYSDGTYPTAYLGEHNSLMKNSSSPEGILYPRHIDEILRRVNECRF